MALFILGFSLGAAFGCTFGIWLTARALERGIARKLDEAGARELRWYWHETNVN